MGFQLGSGCYSGEDFRGTKAHRPGGQRRKGQGGTAPRRRGTARPQVPQQPIHQLLGRQRIFPSIAFYLKISACWSTLEVRICQGSQRQRRRLLNVGRGLVQAVADGGHRHAQLRRGQRHARLAHCLH